VSYDGRAQQATTKSSFRPDIQGLRAIAVVVVVLDHLFHQPQGGFIGVDIFYVISGFLITGVILREYQRTGWVSFSQFYVRRVRRIIPVAVAVLIVVVLAAFVLWSRPRAEQTLLDAFSALTFVANWHFVRVGADYLQADGPISVVQHYWSLSVEEQFYVLWPALVLLVLWVAHKRRQRAIPMLVGLTAVIGVASLVWSVYNTALNPTGAYFDTAGRAWELLAGALLAMFASSLARMGRRMSLTLTWTGLAAIAASLVVISPASPFPGPWALLPVVGTVLVIAGGASDARPVNRLLDNRVSLHLGEISYSLYLWHFPVIIFGLSLLPADVWWTYAVLIAAMLALSELSYRYIEQPFRRSKRVRVPDPRRWRRSSDLALAAGVGVVIVVLSVVQLRGPSEFASAAELRQALSPPQSAAEIAASSASAWTDTFTLTEAIEVAVNAQAWPTLSPSLEELSAVDQAPQMDMRTGCRNTIGAEVPNVCTTSDEPRAKTALVIGDSVAISWMPAVEKALNLDEWQVTGLGFASCPALTAPVGKEECAADQERMLAYAEELKPDLIVVSSAQASVENLSSGATGSRAMAEWETASTATLTRLEAIGSDVVLISNPPAGADPLDCATRVSSPEDCLSEISDAWFDKSTAEQAAARVTGSTYIDTSEWVCNGDDQCPLFAGSTPIRFDQGHLTGKFSGRLGTVLAEYLPVG
jgi:peptidoglycan/LPS O-acetylase OafA/YrhL